MQARPVTRRGLDDAHAAASYSTAAPGSAVANDASSASAASLLDFELGDSSLSIGASSGVHLTAGQILHVAFVLLHARADASVALLDRYVNRVY